MFATIEGLTEHHRSPHVRCPDCPRKFVTSGQMWRHSRDKHGRTQYEQRLATFRQKSEVAKAAKASHQVEPVESEFQQSLVAVAHPQRQLDPAAAPGRSLPMAGGTATMLCLLLAPSDFVKRVGFWDFEHHRCAPFLPLALPFVPVSAWPAARGLLATLNIPEFPLEYLFYGNASRDRQGVIRGSHGKITEGLPALQALLRRVVELFPAASVVTKGRHPPGLQFHFEGLGPLRGPARCYTVSEPQTLTVPVRGLYYLTSTNNGPYLLHDFVGLAPGARPDYPDHSADLDRWYYAPGQATGLPDLTASPLVERALQVPRRSGYVVSNSAFVRLRAGVAADELPGLVELRGFATPYLRSLFDPPNFYWSADEDGEIRSEEEFEEESSEEFVWVRLGGKPAPVACNSTTHCKEFYDEVARLRPATSPTFKLWCDRAQLPVAWEVKVFSLVGRNSVVEIEDEGEETAAGQSGLWGDLEPVPPPSALPCIDSFFDLFS